MTKPKLIIILVLLIGLGIFLASTLGQNGAVFNNNRATAPSEDPIDVVSEMANRWLANQTSTTSLSMTDFLATESAIAKELKQELRVVADDVDPLLCQAALPARIGVKEIFADTDKAQVMIIPRGGEKTPNKSIVTLDVIRGVWVISDISCSTGEVAEQVGEYAFEQTGRLAKGSVPAPYDNSAWHVLFTGEAGLFGAAELLFDDSSVCMTGGVTGVCDQSVWEEGMQVKVQADMTETGALVRRLETE